MPRPAENSQPNPTSFAILKPIKPKKENAKNKKELLPKPPSSCNATPSELNIETTKKAKKAKTPGEQKQPKNPKKPKLQSDKNLVKQEPQDNENTNNSTQENILHKQHQVLLAQFQQQQQQQQQQHNAFYQQNHQQQQTGFALPFVNKLIQGGGLNAPAASSTPAPSPLLHNNFQIMPMNSLINSFYPWKQFEGYNNGVTGNF